jgi:hypothetical protein
MKEKSVDETAVVAEEEGMTEISDSQRGSIHVQ